MDYVCEKNNYAMQRESGHRNYSTVAGCSLDYNQWNVRCSQSPGVMAMTVFLVSETAGVPADGTAVFHALYL